MPNTAPADVRQLFVGTVIYLYELNLTRLNDGTPLIYRFVNYQDGLENVSWGGNEYFPVALKEDGFKYSSTGPSGRPKISISNINNIYTPLTIEFNDFKGATLRRIITFERCLDGRPGANTDETLADQIFLVDSKSSHDSNGLITFELMPFEESDDARIGRQILNYCGLVYRRYKNSAFDYTGVTCPYRGTAYFDKSGKPQTSPALDGCGKRISHCRMRGNDPDGRPMEKHFDGFPNAKR